MKKSSRQEDYSKNVVHKVTSRRKNIDIVLVFLAENIVSRILSPPTSSLDVGQIERERERKCLRNITYLTKHNVLCTLLFLCAKNITFLFNLVREALGFPLFCENTRCMFARY